MCLKAANFSRFKTNIRVNIPSGYSAFLVTAVGTLKTSAVMAEARDSVVARSIRRSGASITRVLNPIRGDNSTISRVRSALSPSTSLQPRRTSHTGNDAATDDDDDGEMSHWRLAQFVLTDSVCGAILNAISDHPKVTFWALWNLQHWNRRSRYDFAYCAYPSWSLCFCWPFMTAWKTGLLGMYKGVKWHIASNILSNAVNWGLALCRKFFNIKLSKKNRRRIAAGCAVVPQMFLQVRA